MSARDALWIGLAASVCACSSTPATELDAGVDAAVIVDAPLKEDQDRPRVRVVPTEYPRTPPALPSYSQGTCPTLRAGPDAASALNADFVSGAHHRRFRLVVPRSYDPSGSDRWPLVFAWHWLAGSSEQMVREGEFELSAERYRMIMVVPDQLAVNGENANPFDWPFLPPGDPAPEGLFFDDLLACVSGQFRIDPARVHGMGVSAGGLWLTAITSTERARYFASVAFLSGGLGQLSRVLQMQYTPEPNKFPSLVLWGGVTDRFIIDFDAASQRLRDALVDDGHFVVTCAHDRGHALPPLVAPGPGESKFAFVWNFFTDHPYGLAPATSPYLSRGLPATAPSWCAIPGEITAGAASGR